MAVRIRLTRVGATKQPTYRIVVADSRSARDSRSIETLGHYNPRKDPVEFEVDADKAKSWIARGALPSDTVARLFRNAGVMPPNPAIEARNAARFVPGRSPPGRAGPAVHARFIGGSHGASSASAASASLR